MTLVSSKYYGNEVYYIPFDAPWPALQHGISGVLIVNMSPYPTGSFKIIDQMFSLIGNFILRWLMLDKQIFDETNSLRNVSLAMLVISLWYCCWLSCGDFDCQKSGIIDPW